MARLSFVNSADSHVIEPSDLWVEALPSTSKARGLRVELDPASGAERLWIDGRVVGFNPFEASPEHLLHTRGASGEGLSEGESTEGRLAMLDGQGVWGELLLPLRGLCIYAATDAQLSMELATIYNDWVLDAYLKASPRWAGAAVIPLHDIALACHEVERCLALGFRTFALPTTPPEGVRRFSAYNSTDFNPLWAVLNAAKATVVLHAGTGEQTEIETGDGGAVISYVASYIPAQRSIAALVGSGVLAHHPEMHVATLEVGSSWLSAFAERMDEGYTQQGMYTTPKLPMLPSDYVRRQIHTSFQHDRAALRTTDITGGQALLFATDYPHLQGTWPQTRRTVDEIFADERVPEDVRRAVTAESLAALVGLPAPTAGWLAGQHEHESATVVAP
jgi:predicted TIM-barrel fold metal-dependent hydrolase